MTRRFRIVKRWVSGVPVGLSLALSLFYATPHANGQHAGTVRIGILTDAQYCNCEADEKRMYRLSLAKLDSAAAVLNAQSLDAVFHLGDMVDHNYFSFDSVMPRFRKFSPAIHFVLGNHDFMIQKKYRPLVMQRIGMKEDHYVVELRDWRVIVLNGDDLSFYAPQDKKHKKERNEVVGDLYSQLEFNGMPWNGGIGRDQLNWLKEKLDESQEAGRKVIIACHFPLFTKEDHNLFNNKQVFDLIAAYPCVKAYFCGHYHSGSYLEKQGIHIVNFKGMVDTKHNAFAVVTLTDDAIRIKGYGREVDRVLKIR